MMRTSQERAVSGGGKRRGAPGFLAGIAGATALVCAVSIGVGCGGATGEPTCESDDDCPPGPLRCHQGLTSYPNGTSLPAGDGCNDCTCSDGEWSCTARGCPGNACMYGGLIRADGSSFPADDGCNQCSCHDGAVACTERACVPPSCSYDGLLLPNGASAPASDGCNSCSCVDGRLQCTLIDCGNQCRSNADCGDAQYCAFTVGNCASVGQAASGSADAETEEPPAPSGQLPFAPGECQDRPTLCAEEPRQVCGCDGQTYRSPCAAASLGLNLQSTGACAQGS
jgi:hypothetical protein